MVPAGTYFMMGDNRDNSQDSRTAQVGYVPLENLIGRVERVIFSIDADSSGGGFPVRFERIGTAVR